MAHVKTAMEEYGIDGNWITVENLKQILDQFRDEMVMQLQNFGGSQVAVVEVDRVETSDGYRLHFYNNKMKRVPENWRFLCCGTFDLWQQWWIGDWV